MYHLHLRKIFRCCLHLGVVPEYFHQSKDAFGILQNLYNLGPAVSRLPLLIDYYEVLMKTDRGEEADALVNEILGVIRTKLKANHKDCKRLAQQYFDDRSFFKSILLDLLGNHLLPNDNDNEKILAGISRNMTSLQKSIKKVCKESCTYKKTVREWILPRVRVTLQNVFENVGGKSKKALTIVEVACKHKLEIAQGYVDDLNAAESTLISAKDLLTSVLGDEAREIHLLGTLLNNLGATYLRQRKPELALQYLNEAMTINKNAKDYDTEAERDSDLKRTSAALARAEQILRNQP